MIFRQFFRSWSSLSGAGRSPGLSRRRRNGASAPCDGRTGTSLRAGFLCPPQPNGSQLTMCCGYMTVSEAESALRPVYFAVHPDFFGQYPDIRSINEQSLKALNGYLSVICDHVEKHHHFRQHLSKPIDITFYVKRIKTPPPLNSPDITLNQLKQADQSAEPCESRDTFQQIKLRLHRNDAHAAVQEILQSFSMPTDHVRKRHASSPTTTHEIDWQQVFRSYYAPPNAQSTATGDRKRAPFVDADFEDFWRKISGHRRHQRRQEAAAKSLARNLRDAIRIFGTESKMKKATQSRVHAEIDLILRDLCGGDGPFAEVRWDNDWTLANIRGSLSTLRRLVNNNSCIRLDASRNARISTSGENDAESSSAAKPKLKLASGQSFLSASGVLMLGYEDVPETWHRVIQKYGSPLRVESVLASLSLLEVDLGQILGGGMRAQRPATASARQYCDWLEELVPVLKAGLVWLNSTDSLAKSGPYNFKKTAAGAKAKTLSDYLPVEASGLRVLVQGKWCSPMVNNEGHVIVPCNIDAQAFVDYLAEHASYARYRSEIWAAQQQRLEALKADCLQSLRLDDLSWEAEQLLDRKTLIGCLERLAKLKTANQSDAVVDLLRGHSIHILASNDADYVDNHWDPLVSLLASSKYSVKPDGRITIPANWEF